MIHRPMLFSWVLLASFVSCSVVGAISTPQENGEKATSLRGGVIERQLNPAVTNCGCDSCTEDVLNSVADGFSCGNRINWVITNLDYSESEACILVASDEFPSICGGCDPSKCSGNDPAPSPDPSPSLCGCSSCTEEVWNTLAGEPAYSCGSRISWLQAQDIETLLNIGVTEGLLDEAAACRLVSEEFPETCTCNPVDCNEPSTISPTPLPTPSPTPLPTFSPTQSPTTKEPTLSPTTSPTISPTPLPTPNPSPPPVEPNSNQICGCASCTDEVLDSIAGDYSCRNRINWVISQGLSETESCKIVSDEFPPICGKCHSDHCGSFPPTPTPVTSGTVTAMSYNTEYAGYYDGRVPSFAAKIAEVSPDVVGLQECQDPYALVGLSGYSLLINTGPQNYILYDERRLQRLDSGWMDIPRDNYAQRTITWGKFRIIENGSEFWFFNTHLPHNGAEATDRNTHARIGRSLLTKREELGARNDPTIVVGDCNPFASSGASEGSFESNLATGGIPKVYEARGNKGGYGGLDKIFASAGHWTASNAADRGTGSSDHPAISADMSLK